MTAQFPSLFPFHLLLLLLSSTYAGASLLSKSESKMPYIIHTDDSTQPPHFATQGEWYSSLMESVTESDSTPSIFYTYNIVLHGFAAKLSAKEAQNMKIIRGIINVYPDRILQLHTTRSPEFLGLNVNSGLWPETNFGDDIIVGLVDSGIWPESKSFRDEGLAPIGPEWKGECENGTLFNSTYCNNKLIGARFFPAGFEANFGPIDEGSGEYRSPRDALGHGTHTASTAAGAEVPNANISGFANGTARGMATKARIAQYKACWFGMCANSDILAAIDKAIEDGVQILSMSIGSAEAIPYYKDVIAIGAFQAVKNGIFVSCSAGNAGPSPSTVINTAPWITTVGAGTLDRSFPAHIRLGNGKHYVGQSLYNQTVEVSTTFPLVHLNICTSLDIIPDNVMGKIVVCEQADVSTAILVQGAGGVGMVALNGPYEGEAITPSLFTLPALSIGYKDTQQVKSYIKKTKNPVASLNLAGVTLVGKVRAPMVAWFSSTGPNPNVPELLKPDVLAPGVSILAAWADWQLQFDLLDGTSMSCPHVAGLAALLRKAHPAWSPAAIRSALMTTSSVLDNDYLPIVMNNNLKKATPLDFGSGQVNPQMALSPGLVYDADIADYVNFLCTLNYTEKELRSIVKEPISCTKFEDGPGQLNYPSFSVVFDGTRTEHVLTRTLTNVEEESESYTVRVINPMPDKVDILVKPQMLMFREAYEKQSYIVEFKSKAARINATEFGYLIWESDVHAVRSPIALIWKA
ncbi:hypothetical protein ACLOJK_032351 [Asimina triloba]